MTNPAWTSTPPTVAGEYRWRQSIPCAHCGMSKPLHGSTTVIDSARGPLALTHEGAFCAVAYFVPQFGGYGERGPLEWQGPLPAGEG